MFRPSSDSPTKIKIPSPTQSPENASGEGPPSETELRFVKITEKMTKLDISVDPSNPKAINNTKAKLEEIIRDLEEFSKDCKESVDSEKIPSLMSDISDLLQQVQILYSHISKQAKAIDRYEDEGESYDEEELSREEIAKLLLLTSKAFRGQQITAEQRGFIKDKVVKREGYLRKILQQEELGTVVNALVTFANIP